MRVFHQNDSDSRQDIAAFAIGALGGLAIGVAMSRPAPRRRAAGLGRDIRERVREAGERAKSTAQRLQPARLRRMASEQARLTELEDRVLDVFLSNGTLSERGIDVGAISPGIIELSGSVRSESEADEAVRLAGTVPGVATVVNRMATDAGAARQAPAWNESEAHPETRWSGRGAGMSRRRQAAETDPDRPDDSQPLREEALRDADRDQWHDEGIAARGNSKTSETAEVERGDRPRFRDDELDNQDPHGKRAARTLDEQPQALNSAGRVGEGLESGTHLQLEESELPEKPHGRAGERPPEAQAPVEPTPE